MTARPQPGEKGYYPRGTGLIMLGLLMLIAGNVLMLVALIWQLVAS